MRNAFEAGDPTMERELHRELEKARRVNGRNLNLIRFAGVSLLFGLSLLMDPILGIEKWRGNLGPFFTYWLLAGVLYLISRRSARGALLASLAIPFVDMPAVFLIQRESFATGDPLGIASFSLALYLFLVVLAASTLRVWQIVLAGAVGAALEATLLRLAQADYGTVAAALVLIALVTAGSAEAQRRIVRTVLGFARAEARRTHLGRYFSPQVAAALEQSALHPMCSRRCDVTVLFSDLRGFTSLSETMDGAEVVALLNDYLTRMVEAVHSLEGTLDKFLGDGILVYFGAPLEQADHARRAIRCARRMLREVEGINESRAARNEPPLEVGIGIHSGEVLLGTIGSPQRREFTVIGDVVNVASRIEGVTKDFPWPVLISEATRRRVPDVAVAPLPPVRVKGKTAPLALFAPHPGTGPSHHRPRPEEPLPRADGNERRSHEPRQRPCHADLRAAAGRGPH